MFGKIRSYITEKKYKKKGIRIAEYVELSAVELDEYVNFAHHAQASNAKIGKRTSVGRYSKIQYSNIGKYCSISWDVTIGALGHPLSSVSTHAFSYRKQFGLCDKDQYLEHETVNIGNDVWIGTGVIIMPGVTVGDGAVIGAGAVVTHDVSPYEVVAGCPAKHLKWRFSEEVIQRLLKIKWWDLPDDVIRKNIDLFDYKNDISKDDTIGDLELLREQMTRQ